MSVPASHDELMETLKKYTPPTVTTRPYSVVRAAVFRHHQPGGLQRREEPRGGDAEGWSHLRVHKPVVVTTAAFILGLIGAVTGVGSLGWTVASWVLSGGRLRLECEFTAVADDQRGSHGIVNERGTDVIALAMGVYHGPAADLGPRTIGVQVVAHNVGRTPLVVCSIALGCGPRHRKTEGMFWGRTDSTSVPLRLEPGETGMYFWPINSVRSLAAITPRKPGRDTIRFFATASTATRSKVRSEQLLPVTLDDLAKLVALR